MEHFFSYLASKMYIYINRDDKIFCFFISNISYKILSCRTYINTNLETLYVYLKQYYYRLLIMQETIRAEDKNSLHATVHTECSSVQNSFTFAKKKTKCEVSYSVTIIHRKLHLRRIVNQKRSTMLACYLLLLKPFTISIILFTLIILSPA